jgi:threonylcarbamoyladenosine tRNA methylthiotransferase CDKAL1
MASIGDIEDLGRSDTFRANRSQVVARVKKKSLSLSTKSEDTDEDLEAIRVDSFIPNKYRIYLKTWGCAHNTSDEEYMAGLLAAYGFQLVSEPKTAHLLLLNSCTVKNPSEDHFRNEVQKGFNAGQHVVVSGCVPQSAPKLDYINRLSVIGVQQIDRCVEVVEETLKGNIVRLLGVKKEGKRKTGGSSLDMPKVRRNPLIEIIAINTGCLNECTYCKTRHARGVLGSYGIEDIVQRAQKSFRDGVKEIWLTSEDTGAYGRDIGTNLPQLLYALIDVIPDDCRLRLGMNYSCFMSIILKSVIHIMLDRYDKSALYFRALGGHGRCEPFICRTFH